MLLLPKFTGVAVFDQANEGAQEAHAELQNPAELSYTGPDQASSARAARSSSSRTRRRRTSRL